MCSHLDTERIRAPLYSQEATSPAIIARNFKVSSRKRLRDHRLPVRIETGTLESRKAGANYTLAYTYVCIHAHVSRSRDGVPGG